MPLAFVVDTLDTVPEPQKALYAARADGKFQLVVEGLPNNDGLISALDKERESARTAEKARKELELKYQGVDPVKYRLIMEKAHGDEEAALIAAGKFDEAFEKRLTKHTESWQKKLEAEMGQTKTEKARAEKFLEKVLESHLLAAFNGKTHPAAMKAALREAREVFTLDEHGNAVQRDANGLIVIGKDGKTPFSPVEWIDSDAVRSGSPYLFPATGGGGGQKQSSKDTPPGTKTMTRADHDERVAKGESLGKFFKDGGTLVD